MKERLNFSPKPFRERSRNLMLLWLVNLILLVAIAWSLQYWRGLHQSNAATHASIADIQAEQRAVGEDYSRALASLSDLDTREYLKQVTQFHSIQNAFRTHWGRLLDDLSDILPEDVRILRMRPSLSAAARRGGSDDTTILEMEGQARYKDAQLAFIKALQEHAAFENVRFQTETYDIDGVAVQFILSLSFRVDEADTP